MSPPDPGTDPRGKLWWASEPNTDHFVIDSRSIIDGLR